MKRNYAAAFLAATTIAICGCSGTSTIPSPTLQVTHPRASRASAEATFVMHWPASASKQASTAGAHLHRFLISPSAQSVSVQVNSQTPTVLNRPSGSGITTSNITLIAPVGPDVFSIKLYDQDNATGNLLGETAVSKTIVANTANTVSATVNGVLGKIALGPASSQPFVEGDATTGFILVGGQAESFIATPEDADGNAIVAPGTIPKIALASTSSAITVTPGLTNQFKLQAVAATGSTVELVATSAGSAVSQSFNLTEKAAIYVPNFLNNTITVYDQTGNQITPSGAFPGLDSPNGIALDTLNGNLYVSDPGNNTVTAYTQNGTQVTGLSGGFPNLSGPAGIVYDETVNAIYVANAGNGTVTEYDAIGDQITASGGFPGLSAPLDIAVDPANTLLYVTDDATDKVLRFDANGNSVPTIGSFSGVLGPEGIAYDSANNELYVGDNFTGEAPHEFDPEGNSIAASGGFPGITVALGVTFNPINDEVYVNSEGSVLAFGQDGSPLGAAVPPTNLHGAIFPVVIP